MAIRTRTRIIDVGEEAKATKPTVTEDMSKAAVALFVANQAKNKAAGAERKAQKALDGLMARANEGKAWKFAQSQGDKVLDVEYAQGDREGVDATLLFGMVNKDTFLKIVTAAAGKVKDLAGSNVEAACKVTSKDDWKAKVKERK